MRKVQLDKIATIEDFARRLGINNLTELRSSPVLSESKYPLSGDGAGKGAT
jgi:hypothetical protein